LIVSSVNIHAVALRRRFVGGHRLNRATTSRVSARGQASGMAMLRVTNQCRRHRHHGRAGEQFTTPRRIRGRRLPRRDMHTRNHRLNPHRAVLVGRPSRATDRTTGESVSADSLMRSHVGMVSVT
jgi:hypothetical protein